MTKAEVQNVGKSVLGGDIRDIKCDYSFGELRSATNLSRGALSCLKILNTG
jgi:hypothetical protein